MSGIQSMVVGGKYNCGDGGGYDIVQCLEVMPNHEISEGQFVFAVKVAYCRVIFGVWSPSQDDTDLWFEAPGNEYSIYVEPLMET